MIKIDTKGVFLVGPKGSLPISEDDEITLKVGMLFEGECEGIGATRAARKFGYTRQRYYQILQLFKRKGARALKRLKPGTKEEVQKDR